MRALRFAGLCLALACGSTTSDPAPPDLHLLFEEARYRIVSHSQESELRVEVQTTGGWHIAPEAPARLDLSSGALEFAEPALRAEHQQALTDDGFAFATRVSSDRAGRHTATGRLKFGICEGPKAQCVIVRRELAIPVDIAHAASAAP